MYRDSRLFESVERVRRVRLAVVGRSKANGYGLSSPRLGLHPLEIGGGGLSGYTPTSTDSKSQRC